LGLVLPVCRGMRTGCAASPPVRDHTGAVVAGLSVWAPAYGFFRDDVAEFVQLVLRTSAELSGRLGYQSSDATYTD